MDARVGLMTQMAITEPAARASMTIEEWAAMPEDEPGELVDGQLVEEEVPDLVHELIVGFFLEVLRRWIVPRGGIVAGSEVKFALKPRKGRKPDASVFLPGSRKPPSRGAVSIPPDIMIEIVSPSLRDGRRDRVEKTREYAAFGVRWYWILDPQLRSLEILELGPNGRYQVAHGATDGTVHEVPGCEGLSLDLDALWSEVDRLESPEAPTDEGAATE